MGDLDFLGDIIGIGCLVDDIAVPRVKMAIALSPKPALLIGLQMRIPSCEARVMIHVLRGDDAFFQIRFGTG